MEAKLCFIGHGLIENRSGLLAPAPLTRVSGHTEWLVALEMMQLVDFHIFRMADAYFLRFG